MKSHFKKNLLIISACILVMAIICGLAAGRKLNPLVVGKYEVKLVDASHYQGNISWDTLADEGISFAYIKATEGSTYVDDCYASNAQNAELADIYVGAYHFFSFSSPGNKQALNFIETVGSLSGMLAPVVDVETYGGIKPDNDIIKKELDDFLSTLEEFYGVKPIIYTTMAMYFELIKDNYDEYPLWIRNVYFKPDILLNRKWDIWQYSDKGELPGYDGEEKHIDLNVSHYSRDEFIDRFLIE